jgi:putative membrane protein
MGKRPSLGQALVLFFGMAGAGWCAYLFIHQGIQTILAEVKAAGWGVAAVLVFHLTPLLCDTVGWLMLLPQRERLRLGQLYFIRWLGDSVNSMLPVGQLGGEFLRVRLAIFDGLSYPNAAASVLAGMTVGILTQIFFALSGLWFLLDMTGRKSLARPVLIGSVIAMLFVAVFYFVQRAGVFRFVGTIIANFMKSPEWQKLAINGQHIDEAVRELYSRPGALLACTFFTMAAWATSAVEVWIALVALGLPSNYEKAYVLEAAAQTIRSVFFLLPGALGAQEGGYLAVGALLGIPADAAMALALIRRVRELAFGVPGVMAWQWVEWRRLRSTPAAVAEDSTTSVCTETEIPRPLSAPADASR